MSSRLVVFHTVVMCEWLGSNVRPHRQSRVWLGSKVKRTSPEKPACSCQNNEITRPLFCCTVPQTIWAGFFVLCSRGVVGGAGWLTLVGPMFVVSFCVSRREHRAPPLPLLRSFVGTHRVRVAKAVCCTELENRVTAGCCRSCHRSFLTYVCNVNCPCKFSF